MLADDHSACSLQARIDSPDILLVGVLNLNPEEDFEFAEKAAKEKALSFSDVSKRADALSHNSKLKTFVSTSSKVESVLDDIRVGLEAQEGGTTAAALSQEEENFVDRVVNTKVILRAAQASMNRHVRLKYLNNQR